LQYFVDFGEFISSNYRQKNVWAIVTM